MARFVAACRSALYFVFLVVTVVPWATVAVLYSIFVRGERLYWVCAGWLGVSVWGARVICGVQARVHGRENLPDSPVVLLSKHQSAWETLAFPALMPKPLCYVFKRELLWIPFFGWAMARMDLIHIDRSKRAEAWSKVAEQGRRFMAQGNWVIMFPEGTRTPRGSQGIYKHGGTRLAIETGRPVMPVAVTSARCWPRKSFVLRPGIVDISIGKPIDSTGRS
jgi:1-acyl-sn-glycerol-3-phosphate acyltransferase